MSSQRSVDSLSEPLDDCFAIDKHNFPENLPRLKDFLRKSDRSLQLRAVKTLLGPCVALCSPVQLGKTLLDDAAPVARQLFFEAINEVDELVSSTTFNVLDDVRGRLECCEDLLECWLQCLAQLGKFSKLSASQVRGVLENLVDVIKRSFEHCKTSEDVYGNLFEKAKERLTVLFRKTTEVQNLFSSIMERVIVFSKDVEGELSALAKVVSFAGKICLLVDGLDMKTVAESWKGFTRLAIAYSNDLKLVSPPSVTSHLASLADAVSSSIPSTVTDSDHRNSERSIKLQKLLLKILHRLCLCYSGHLGNDAASAIVRLLVQLHRYSPVCLKMLNIHLGIIDCVEANFTPGMDQLLESVIRDAEFKQAFFKYQIKEAPDHVGFHFLTLFIVDKLMATSNETLIITWRTRSHDILEVLFANINALEEELFAGELRLGNLPLYDSTLTSICSFVVSIRVVDFPSLEILMLKYLLGGYFWSSLLASDVWCFLNKYASNSDLSYDHLIYLMSVYEMLINRCDCMEAVILGNLISRLYAISLSQTKNRLIDKFETKKYRSWAPLKNYVPQSDQIFLSELSSTDVENVSSTWKILEKQPSAEIWSRLTNELTIIGNFGKSKDETVFKTLHTIWNCLGKSINEFDGIHLHLITQLAIALLEATQTLQNENEYLISIITTLTSLMQRTVPPLLRLRVSNYLRDSIDNLGNVNQELKESLAKLYCFLLQDKNPLIKEEALESFAHVTNASYNEDLVIGIVDAVAEVPEISDSVSLYLSQTPPNEIRGFTSLETYLRKLIIAYQYATGNHHCSEQADSHRDEKRRKIIIGEDNKTSHETPQEIRERLSRIYQDIDYILLRKHDLDQSSLDKLDIIVNKILSAN